MSPKWSMLLAVLAAVGCRKPESPAVPAAADSGPKPNDESGPAVATFAGHRITTAEFQKYFDEQSPFVQTHYQSEEGKKAILDIMIETQLLADQAKKEGFEHNDEALEQLRKAMIRQWRRAKFNDAEGRRSIPESELRADYQAHAAEYQRPERMRAQMIFFKADPAHQAAVRAEADEAYRSLSSDKDGAAFSHLARKRSDDTVSRNKNGDLDFRSHDELATAYGKAVADAVAALKSAGEVSPVVAANGGFYLLQLTGRTPASERTFAEVEPEIRYRLWEQKRIVNYDNFIKTMMEQAHVQVDDNEIAKVNHGTSLEKEPEPPYGGPVPSLDQELREPLPPYREYTPDTVGPVIATFGGHRITTAQLQRYFDEEGPTLRQNFSSEKAKRGLVDEFILGQLLVDEALKDHFEQDEIAQVHFRRAMIGEWMEANYDDDKGEASFSKDEVRAYYQAHGNGRQLDPERVRMIFFKASPDHEAAVQSEAEQAFRSLSATKDGAAFAHLAQTRSDDAASRPRGGDLDVVSHDELAKTFGEAVASAVDALNAPGEVSRPVHGHGGTYLLQLEQRLPVFDRGFEASERALRSQMWNDRRNKLLDAYMAKLKAQGVIQIDEAELAKVKPNPANLTDDAPHRAAIPPLPWSRLNTPVPSFRDSAPDAGPRVPSP